MKRHLTIFFLFLSYNSYSQVSFDFSMGIGKPILTHLVFNNPKLNGKQSEFLTDLNGKPGIVASVNYRKTKKYFRHDVGVQYNFYSYEFLPFLSSDAELKPVIISTNCFSLYTVFNFSINGFSIGAGPQVKYISRPKVLSVSRIDYNSLINTPISAGLRFHSDYSFTVLEQQILIGYDLEMYLPVSQLDLQMLFNNDSRDIFLHEIPLNHHSFKVGYVF